MTVTSLEISEGGSGSFDDVVAVSTFVTNGKVSGTFFILFSYYLLTFFALFVLRPDFIYLLFYLFIFFFVSKTVTASECTLSGGVLQGTGPCVSS